MKFRSLALCCSLLLVQPVYAAGTAAAYYESALKYSQQQQWRAAELELRNSLQQDPNYLPARLLLGKVMSKAGQWASAEKELELALNGGAAAVPLIFDVMRAKLALGKTDDVAYLLKHYQQYQAEAGYQLMQANLLKKTYQYTEAAAAYQQLLQSPGALADEAWFELAELQFKQQQLNEAGQSLSQIMPATEFYRQSRYLQAQLLQQQQKTAEALALYDQLLADKPQDAAALLGKAQLLMQQNDTAGALKLIVLFRQSYPDNPYGQLIHASILGSKGQDKEQNRLLRQVEQQLSALSGEQREQEDALLLSAVLLFSHEQYEEALVKLYRYQKLYPANARVSQLLAQAHLQQKNYKEAENHIRQAIQLNPQDHQLYLIAASLYQQTKEPAKELDMLNNAFRRFPTDSQVRQAYVIALIRSGDSAQARQLLVAGDGAQPQLSALVTLGYLQLEAGDFKAAFDTATQLLKMDQSKVEIFQFAGDVSAKMAQPERAKQFYQQVLVLDANFKPALLSLASLALQQQQLSEAAGYYQTLLQQQPADPLVLQLLADTAVKRGQISEATALLAQLPTDRDEYIPALQTLFELYLLDNQLSAASELLHNISERIAVTPFLYQSRAKLALAQQKSEEVSHNTDILFGLWFDERNDLYKLTDLQLRNRDQAGAGKTLQRLTELDGNTAEISLFQARLALLQGKAERSLQLIASLRQAGYQQAVLDELTAHCYLLQNKTSAAAAVLQQLYVKEPADAYFQQLRQLYRQTTDQPALTNLLQQRLQQPPADLSVVIELADLYQQQQQPAAAITLYESQADLTQQPVLLNNLANLYLERDATKALSYAKQAYELLPGQPDITDTYGYALVRAGKLSEGLGLLRDAEIRQPDNLMLQLHLAEALHLLARHAEAQQQLSRLQGKKLTAEQRRLFDRLQQQIQP